MRKQYENFHIFHFQKRIVAAETIRGNTVSQKMLFIAAIYVYRYSFASKMNCIGMHFAMKNVSLYNIICAYVYISKYHEMGNLELVV